MRVIIVGRDRELLNPLAAKLTEHGFEVMLMENSSAVLSYIKQNSIQFLLADSTLLRNLDDPEFLEKYARENYLMRREGDHVYVILQR